MNPAQRLSSCLLVNMSCDPSANSLFEIFFFLQLTVNIFLAFIVGAIFFGVKDDQSGIQNR